MHVNYIPFKMKSTYIIIKRREQVIISRIRVGHSKHTHRYLLKGKKQPDFVIVL